MEMQSTRKRGQSGAAGRRSGLSHGAFAPLTPARPASSALAVLTLS